MDKLTSAIVEAGRDAAAAKKWGRPPQLYALVTRVALEPVGPDLPDAVRDARQDDLIPVKQDPLPDGKPDEVLASIHWPDEVEGCVLVTELVLLPPGSEEDMPSEPGAAAEWVARQPEGREARLIVGVLRDGHYASCLQLRGEDELLVGDVPVDDIVTSLLGTF